MTTSPRCVRRRRSAPRRRHDRASRDDRSLTFALGDGECFGSGGRRVPGIPASDRHGKLERDDDPVLVCGAGLYTGPLTPQIAMAAGGGSIRRAYLAGDIPGTYAVDIRAGTSTMQLNISIAGMTQTVFIGVD